MEIEQLHQELSQRGLKLTKPRQAILQALAQENGWVTASALFERLLIDCPRMNFSTVCRNLDILSISGLLCRVDRDNKGTFAYCLPEIPGHHHHLICRSCGRIIPMNYCPMQQLSNADTGEYNNLECRFEVYGICRECQS